MSKRVCLTAVVACAMAMTAGAAFAQSDSNALEAARETLAQWVETQQMISKEREDWAVGRDVLEQRIGLLEGEIASLDEKIAETREGISEADVKQRDLEAEKKDLESALTGLSAVVERLESKSRTLLASLPDPIRERVDPLARRLPAADSKEPMTLGQRFQNVIGILNEINKFNAAITVANELRQLSDGSTAEVRTIYVGLGQAWYVSTRGDAAGVGRPTAEGWEWDSMNALAPEISQAIKILENEEVPAYVPLPVTIR